MYTPGKLNRSHSESELYRLNFENLCVEDRSARFEKNFPVVKKTVLIFEEVYHGGPVTLKSGQSVPSQLHKIEYLSSGLNNTVTKNYSDKLNGNDGITPMDVDLMYNNNLKAEEHLADEKMDVDTDYYKYKDERLYRIDQILKNRKFKQGNIASSEGELLESDVHIHPIIREKKGWQCNTTIFIVLIFLLTLLYIWFNQDSIIFVNSDVQLQNIKKDLLDNVYEQKGPVNVVIRSLELRSHWPNKIKTLGFIGSSGIGKTFVANILKKHFHPDLVHELYGIHLNFKSQWENILKRLKTCCLNLIIVDDLSKKDTIELFALVHSLPEDYYVLVVSIFSIQYADDELNYTINFDDIDQIRREFDNSGLFHELAVFRQFDTRQSKDWLKKQLEVQNVSYSEKLLNVILYDHNVSYKGFKGLYAKLLLELEKIL